MTFITGLFLCALIFLKVEGEHCNRFAATFLFRLDFAAHFLKVSQFATVYDCNPPPPRHFLAVKIIAIRTTIEKSANSKQQRLKAITVKVFYFYIPITNLDLYVTTILYWILEFPLWFLPSPEVWSWHLLDISSKSSKKISEFSH